MGDRSERMSSSFALPNSSAWRASTMRSLFIRPPPPVHVLPIFLVPLLDGKSLEFGQDDRHTDIAARQAAGGLASSEGRQSFLVKIGYFQESRQRRVEGFGDRLHD